MFLLCEDRRLASAGGEVFVVKILFEIAVGHGDLIHGPVQLFFDLSSVLRHDEVVAHRREIGYYPIVVIGADVGDGHRVHRAAVERLKQVRRGVDVYGPHAQSVGLGPLAEFYSVDGAFCDAYLHVLKGADVVIGVKPVV